MKKILLIIIILGFVFAYVPPSAAQEEQAPIQAPETIQEAQGLGLQILQGIPGAVKEVWEGEVLPLWAKMWQIAKNIWDRYIFSWIRSLWEQLLSLFGQEIEKRKPIIEQEFQREKEELKQELKEKIPDPQKTLWDLIKGFLPGNETK